MEPAAWTDDKRWVQLSRAEGDLVVTLDRTWEGRSHRVLSVTRVSLFHLGWTAVHDHSSLQPGSLGLKRSSHLSLLSCASLLGTTVTTETLNLESTDRNEGDVNLRNSKNYGAFSSKQAYGFHQILRSVNKQDTFGSFSACEQIKFQMFQHLKPCWAKPPIDSVTGIILISQIQNQSRIVQCPSASRWKSLDQKSGASMSKQSNSPHSPTWFHSIVQAGVQWHDHSSLQPTPPWAQTQGFAMLPRLVSNSKAQAILPPQPPKNSGSIDSVCPLLLNDRVNNAYCKTRLVPNTGQLISIKAHNSSIPNEAEMRVLDNGDHAQMEFNLREYGCCIQCPGELWKCYQCHLMPVLNCKRLHSVQEQRSGAASANGIFTEESQYYLIGFRAKGPRWGLLIFQGQGDTPLSGEEKELPNGMG
ncbi:hypothetical protein AAY473_011227 [Plecturocebus cupreus]